MFPCLLGYHHIARRLHSIQDPTKPKNANRYRQWIDNYVADDYTQAVSAGTGMFPSYGEGRKWILTLDSAGREQHIQAVATENRGAGQDLYACDQGECCRASVS